METAGYQWVLCFKWGSIKIQVVAELESVLISDKGHIEVYAELHFAKLLLFVYLFILKSLCHRCVVCLLSYNPFSFLSTLDFN